VLDSDNTQESAPTTAPRYYYQYNAHGDVIALSDVYGGSWPATAPQASGTISSEEPGAIPLQRQAAKHNTPGANQGKVES
jgi:hypothetical protein